MKVCKRCGAQLPDTAESCTRCGSVELAYPQRPQMQGQPVRPQMQGQPRPQGNQPVRPQMQGQPRPQMQGQPRPQMQGQPRPQMQGQPRPQMNGQAGMNNQMNMNMGSQARANNFDPMQGQMNKTQNTEMNNNMGMMHNQTQNNFNQQGFETDQFGNEVSFDPNFQAKPEKKKGLFGGKKGKTDKSAKQPKNTNENTNNQFNDNPFEENNQFAPQGNNNGAFNTPVNNGQFATVTVARWLIIWVQMIIPIWNIIFIIKTLSDSHEDPTIKNYIKAYLIILVISLILGIGSSVLLTSIMVGALS